MQTLQELVGQLPLDLQQEVRDFVEFLLKKRGTKVKSHLKCKLKFHWRGALRDLGHQYTSVELQHKLREWWGD